MTVRNTIVVSGDCSSFRNSWSKVIQKMHGRVRVRTTAEQAALKKQEQAIKVKQYRAGMCRIIAKRKNGELDDEILAISGQILSRNPDVYTLWNIRKEALLKLSVDLDEESKQTLFSRDLGFTEQCLKVNPKSYGAWHHRTWILTNSPDPDWQNEVYLCNKYLKFDERNFHCWDYRRFVVAKAKVSPEDELNFCTKKIEDNFSNYSSWHYRSKLLPLLYPHETNSSRPISEEKLKEELEMVISATFTDPKDSSAWFYQRWLFGYSQPALDIVAARISTDLATISFSKPVNLHECKLESNFGIELDTAKWQPVQTDQIYDGTWTLASDFHPVASELKPVLKCKMPDDEEYVIELEKCSNGLYGVKCPKFEYEFGEAVIEELKYQLDSCNELLKYEPDSKWTLLTASLLMRAVDRKGYHEKSLEYLQMLQKIDFLRKGYYADLASKWTIEKHLEEWIEKKDLTSPINLSKSNLTTIFYEQYMCIADSIDLSNNNILDRTTTKLNTFQFCENLNLSYNKLTTPAVIPHLPKLKKLSLEGNNFSQSAS